MIDHSVKFTIIVDCITSDYPPWLDYARETKHMKQEYVTDNIARFHKKENGDTYVCFKLLEIKEIKDEV